MSGPSNRLSLLRRKSLVVGLLAAGCGAAPAPRPAPSAALPTSAAPETVDVVRFIENDYARALSEAKQRGVPLLVDAWAPWCHTCLSMRAFVFSDEKLRRFAHRFVWLAMDTEREESAPLVDRLHVTVLPTLFVIDPLRQEVMVAWTGSLTAAELAALLEEVAASGPPLGAAAEASARLLQGHRASGRSDSREAVDDYRAALAVAPPGWAQRAEAVDALVARLAEDQRLPECVATAAAEAPRMPPGTALADVLRSGISCARDLPKGAPERDRLEELASLGQRVASDASEPILADDRSDLYDYVIDALRDLGRPADAKRLARTWASFLEGEAARAPDPRARAVFDAHRLLAYVEVNEPERAVPMLEQSERDFPDDYNPPARLASAFLAMKRYDAALSAANRALTRAYGPRKLRLWSLQSDILLAKRDREGARRVLRDALNFARSVPLPGAYPKLRDAIEKRLKELNALP